MPATELIKIAWSLIVMQRPGKVSNPLLPNVLTQLYSFSRPDQPLTNEELIMLYQINVYVKDMVRRGNLPESFINVVPNQVVKASESVYREWESNVNY